MYEGSAQPGRQFFVAQAVGPGRQPMPGHLMVGAAWGDVAPWVMRSLSAKRFEAPQLNEWSKAIRVQFDVGAGGKATAMQFEAGFDEFGTLRRVGDLPAEWQ